MGRSKLSGRGKLSFMIEKYRNVFSMYRMYDFVSTLRKLREYWPIPEGGFYIPYVARGPSELPDHPRTHNKKMLIGDSVQSPRFRNIGKPRASDKLGDSEITSFHICLYYVIQ